MDCSKNNIDKLLMIPSIDLTTIPNKEYTRWLVYEEKVKGLTLIIDQSTKSYTFNNNCYGITIIINDIEDDACCVVMQSDYMLSDILIKFAKIKEYVKENF